MRLERPAGFVDQWVAAGPFPLLTLVKSNGAPEDLAVYIEGDGAAWRGNLPPLDPTPHIPVALLLARQDPRPGVLYVSRPCQYLASDQLRNCSPRFWTVARYGPEVVAALLAAIEEHRRRLGSKRIHLIGYSGGGVLAAYLAVRSPHAASLVTVAAPLDLSGWTRYHGVSALDGADDESLLALRLAGLPQWHLAGADDHVVPAHLIRDFVQRIDGGAHFEIIAGERHDCCWHERWRELLGPMITTVSDRAHSP